MILRGFIVTVFAILLNAFLGGCASPTKSVAGYRGDAIPEEFRSGFLQDYSRVRPVPGKKSEMRWVNPTVDWRDYKGFIIDPVEFRVPPAQQESVHPNPEVVVAVTTHFREALIREIGKSYQIVDKPGTGIGRISTAITSIQPTSKQLSNWDLLPIAFVATVVSSATGMRGKDLAVFMEGEITDSINGNLMLELMKGRVSTKGDARQIEGITPATVKPVLDFWATEQLLILQELR